MKTIMAKMTRLAATQAGIGKYQPHPFILGIGNARLVNRYHGMSSVGYMLYENRRGRISIKVHPFFTFWYSFSITVISRLYTGIYENILLLQ